MNFAPRRRFVLLVVATSILAAACGAGDSPALETSPTAGGESTSFNDADVEFLQQMIPHHEQATEMAELVSDRTDRPELVEFGEKIISDQTGEIDAMQSHLSAAGAEEAAGGHGGMGGMSGMMDESEMAELESLSGDDFDLAFLDMMTRHHEGAIEMAETATAEGQNAEVKQLAANIIKAQRAEIEQMADWQDEWA